MTPEQQAAYEQTEFELRPALELLSQASIGDVPRIHEVRKLIQGAHDIIESVFVEGLGSPEQADRIIEKILAKHI